MLVGEAHLTFSALNSEWDHPILENMDGVALHSDCVRVGLLWPSSVSS